MKTLKKLSKESSMCRLSKKTQKNCISIELTFDNINDEDKKLLDKFYNELLSIQLKNQIKL
jgi:hypothetical protein